MGDEQSAFTVLSGDSEGHTFLNLELVKKVHSA